MEKGGRELCGCEWGWRESVLYGYVLSPPSSNKREGMLPPSPALKRKKEKKKGKDDET